MITRYANTNSTTGGDGTTNATTGANRAYPNLKEAIDSIGASMSDNWTIYHSGTAADTGDLDQGTWDVDTNGYILNIIGQQSPNHFDGAHTGKWDTGKAIITCTNRNGVYNNVPCNLWLEGLEVQVTVNNAGSYIGIKTSNANQLDTVSCKAIWCQVKAVRTSGNVTCFESRPCDGGTTGENLFANCIAWNGYTGFGGDWASNKVYNCLAYGCEFSYVADAAWLVKNCRSAACTNSEFVGTFHASSDYNMDGSDSSAPGTNSLHAQSQSFADAANGDFHIPSADPGIGEGVGPSVDSVVPSTDIDGHTRSGSTCDIGADEYYLAPIVDAPEKLRVVTGARWR